MTRCNYDQLMYAHTESDITFGHFPIARSEASFYSEGLAIMPATMRLSNTRSRLQWRETGNFLSDEGILQGNLSGGERHLTVPSRVRTNLNSHRIVYATE
ncbi:hypothetical protein IG631_19272 [Alternaria alternata]|nr:hypothetical protein IG631_19272 [Alternaria alternata]